MSRDKIIIIVGILLALAVFVFTIYYRSGAF